MSRKYRNTLGGEECRTLMIIFAWVERSFRVSPPPPLILAVTHGPRSYAMSFERVSPPAYLLPLSLRVPLVCTLNEAGAIKKLAKQETNVAAAVVTFFLQ